MFIRAELIYLSLNDEKKRASIGFAFIDLCITYTIVPSFHMLRKYIWYVIIGLVYVFFSILQIFDKQTEYADCICGVTINEVYR